jgi:type II restriction enzyme
MTTTMSTGLATRQQVKTWSETLVAARRCPACCQPTMTVIDEPARDLRCTGCGEHYEVKAKRSATGAVRSRCFPAGSFDAYQRRFSTEPPNLLILSYEGDRKNLQASSIAVVPRTLVSTDLLRPNRESTTRGGRILRLCRVDADQVPPLAMVPLMTGGHEHRPEPAAERLRRWYGLSSSGGSSAPWRRAVLQAIGWLNRAEFTLQEVMVFTPWFHQTFPRAKTPKQTVQRVLQELRDAGVVTFVSRGHYRLR